MDSIQVEQLQPKTKLSFEFKAMLAFCALVLAVPLATALGRWLF